jgi:hypothetical protein
LVFTPSFVALPLIHDAGRIKPSAGISLPQMYGTIASLEMESVVALGSDLTLALF